MTAASQILICPVAELRTLPRAEVDVIRRFLFQHIRGMDPCSDKRWKRLWGDIFHAQAGEGFAVDREEERGGPYHRRHRAILTRLHLSQERFALEDTLHNWLKYGAGFVEPVEGRTPGSVWWKPRSTSFKVCSEDDMREFHTAAVDYLHTERAQRFLWRRVKSSQRQGMLDAVLRTLEEDQ